MIMRTLITRTIAWSRETAQSLTATGARIRAGDWRSMWLFRPRTWRRPWILWRRLRSGRFDVGALLKPVAPRSLFGRSLIIIIAPMVLLQAIVTYVFFERHWDVVTRRLSRATAGDIAMVVETYATLTTREAVTDLFDRAERTMKLNIRFQADDVLPEEDPQAFFPVLDRSLRRDLATRLEVPYWFDTTRYPNHVDIRVAVSGGIGTGTLQILVRRKDVMATSGPIFVIWMLGSSVVLLSVAILFLRNQVRPISRLAEAAEGFGKGRDVAEFRPQGAMEVRRAAIAFIGMKDRIKRHITQRTDMLAGVSHDLRTPITRLKLALAMVDTVPDIQPEIDAMRQDLADMERMLQEYLAFARGQGGESAEATDLRDLMREVVQNAEREGQTVRLSMKGDLTVEVRRNAMARAVTNLIGNAGKHASLTHVRARREATAIRITVDDNGPGIPESKWEEAFRPFHRLDEGRNLEAGGVGLGLSIARDIVRGHGGDLTLDHSALGGLRAIIRIPI